VKPHPLLPSPTVDDPLRYILVWGIQGGRGQVLMSPHCSRVALTAGMPSLSTMAALKRNHMEMFPSIHRQSNNAISCSQSAIRGQLWNSCRSTSAAVELHCYLIALPIKLFSTPLTLIGETNSFFTHQCRQHDFWYSISFISKNEKCRFLTWNGWYGTNVATMNTVSISTTIALPTSLLHPCSQLRDPPFLPGTFGPPS
jgi:hypothetical protein